jgi:ABC-type nitrate/sulfonate/bicarbonate transport system substrate-binding protein
MAAVSRRDLLVRGSAVAGGLALARFARPGLSLAADAVNFQLGWIANVENMGEFVAAEKGYYTAEGLDVTLTPGGPAVSVEPLIVAGKALVGLSQPDIVARANANGANIRVIAATFQKNPSAVMSLASKPIKTPQELAGKKLGIQQQGVPIYDAFFTSIGMDPKSVTYVPVQFDPAPLVSGEVDAFVSFQTNQPIQLKTQGIDTVTFLLADYGFNLYTDNVIASADSLKDAAKRATIVKVIAATIKGWADALADPAMAAKLVVDKYGKSLNLDLNAQTLTAQAEVPLVQTDETKAHGLFVMTDAGIAQNMKTLKQSGIDAVQDELFDASVLTEVYASMGMGTPVATPSS